MTIVVADENGESVRTIEETEARKVLTLPAKKRKAALLSSSVPSPSSPPDDADAFLVLDGMGDAEAWQELRDSLS